MDSTLLGELTFRSPRDNPLHFIEKFESAFPAGSDQDDMALQLRSFIPSYDFHKFDSVFIGPRSDCYDRFKVLFFKSYLKPYLDHRQSELSLKFTDLSSIHQFVVRKCAIYEKLEGLSSKQATEKVFFELPPRMCEEYLCTKGTLCREKLLNFVRFSDLITESHYRALGSDLDDSELNCSQSSNHQPAQQTASTVQPASSSRAIGQDPRIFLNLDSGDETESDQSQPALASLFGQSVAVTPAAPANINQPARKRRNSATEVTLRKDTSTKAKRKKGPLKGK